MAYSVKADILEVLPESDLIQLTDDVPPIDTVDDAKVTSAITRADNQINSYLRGKASTIPIVPTPPRVKDWSVTLAIFQLYRRRVNLDIPATIQEDIDQTISELKGVRDGKILIDDPTSPANTASFYKGDGANKGVIFDSNAEGTGCLDQYYDGPVPGNRLSGNR